MKSNIHKTAVVSKKAVIAEDVEIGPYSIIGDDVILKKGASIGSHVNIFRNTEIGENSKIYPFSSLGTEPQDLKYKGERTFLKIGKDTVVREHCDFNLSTGEGETTLIGDNCLIMAYSHVAHNCVIGNSVVIANVCQLAGHVSVDDFAIIGGLVGVHQFCRIGKYSMTGAFARIKKDVIPFAVVDEDSHTIRTFNHIGMKRRGFSEKDIETVKEMFRLLFHASNNTSQAIEAIESTLPADDPNVNLVVSFIKNTQRGIIK